MVDDEATQEILKVFLEIGAEAEAVEIALNGHQDMALAYLEAGRFDLAAESLTKVAEVFSRMAGYSAKMADGAKAIHESMEKENA